MVGSFTTRFAPSPTGRLHKGHAFSAWTAHTAAQAQAGRFLLRIEDIDRARSRPQFEAAIIEDLTWLGLDWAAPIRRQSDHMDDYAQALERLKARGLLYRCFKTRREILEDIGRAPHGPALAYRGAPLAPAEETARLAAGEPFAWRLSLRAARRALGRAAWDALSFVEEGRGPDGQRGVIQARPALAGDAVLARKDADVAYHLAVVVDDAIQGVSHVIRGEDLHEAAHIQRLLQALLEVPSPIYRHHPLLAAPDGNRLAKRDLSETLADIRARGVSASQLKAELGF